MKNIKWNKATYQEFIEYLYSLQDLKYRDFQASLGIEKNYMIGIKTPILKNIAKEIAKGDYNTFISLNTHQTYEEIAIHGFIICYIKEDFDTIKDKLQEYIEYIDNWALCDLICCNLHIWSSNTKNGLKFIRKALKSKNTWIKRVAIVLLLNYYINDEYINMILDIFKDYNTEEYYVLMASAWLLSFCYIKYPDKVKGLLLSKKLNQNLQNKTIQKIRESNRITKEEKNIIKGWRI